MAEIPIQKKSKAYRVMKTVGEMTTDRGYSVHPEWFVNSLDDFNQNYVSIDGTQILFEKMTCLCSKGPTDSLYVFFNGDENVNVQRIKEYEKRAVDQSVNKVIVVVSGKVNAIARRVMEEMGRGDGVKFQCFEDDDLVVNITHHELVPKHYPLGVEEAKKILDAYSLQVSMLPRILSKDPIVQYFGLEKGSVVRITRTSETAGEYTTYRQVV